MDRLRRVGARMVRTATAGIGATRDAWAVDERSVTGNAVVDRYDELWALYTGTLFRAFDAGYRAGTVAPAVYRNTRLLWKHAEAVVDFYGMAVYDGALSTDGKPLPDGSDGAIPIDPQLGDDADEATVDTLLAAIAELWSAWNWQQRMSLRPTFGAALGDVLTELRDDVGRGFVYPHMVWPGYVSDITLDAVGNVKGYAIEYTSTETVNGETKSYQFGKEVTKTEYRYYRNGRPDEAYPGGPVQPNPYGFVPAVWDRHRIGWTERGMGALDGSLQAIYELNGLFSSAFDAQSKSLNGPMIVKGSLTGNGATTITMPGADRSVDVTTRNRIAQRVAQRMNYIEASGDVDIIQPKYDLGDTLEVMNAIRDGILAEQPEAEFYKKLREMTTLTGPGVERALGDSVKRVQRARASYDPNTVKLHQMAIAMIADGLTSGRYKDAGVDVGSTRLAKFATYALDTYKTGGLDFIIKPRPVIQPTETERVELIAQRHALSTEIELLAAGFDDATIADIIAQRRPRPGTKEYADYMAATVRWLADVEDGIETDYAFGILRIPAADRDAIRDRAGAARQDRTGPLFPVVAPVTPPADPSAPVIPTTTPPTGGGPA